MYMKENKIQLTYRYYVHKKKSRFWLLLPKPSPKNVPYKPPESLISDFVYCF